MFRIVTKKHSHTYILRNNSIILSSFNESLVLIADFKSFGSFYSEFLIYKLYRKTGFFFKSLFRFLSLRSTQISKQKIEIYT